MLSLDQEAQLWHNSAERETYSSLAELYSIVVTLDGLEKAYIRDSITAEEYTPICQRLITQYKAVLQDTSVSNAYQDLDTFRMKCDVRTPLFVRLEKECAFYPMLTPNRSCKHPEQLND